MMRLRHATIAALLCGLALAASLFGAQRISTALLVLVILMLIAANETQRAIIDQLETRK